MPTSVLLSVKPHFANAILDGSKTFEFRRALFASTKVDRVIMYASSPTQRVVGDFRIAGILSMAPEELWGLTKHGAGISWEYFEQYFRGRQVAHAIRVADVRRFVRPRKLEQHYGIGWAPQSFCYLD
jgi:predicted transcriptional regulator